MREWFSRAILIATLMAVSCAGSAQAANYTWQGGDGVWTSANWTTSTGTDQSWANSNTGVFTSGTQTLTLNGNITLSNGDGNLKFFPTTEVSLTVNSGTISTSSAPGGVVSFYNNTGGSTLPVSVTFNDVALRGGSFATYGASGRPIIVEFNAMRNASEGSTIPLIQVGTYNSLRISSTGNIPDTVARIEMSPFTTLDTSVPITIAGGTLQISISTVNTNVGNTISVARVETTPNSNQSFTLNGSGTLAATTLHMRHTSGTNSKVGDGTVIVDDITLVTGSVGFRWQGGTNLINGTTGILGNWSLSSGATLGGTGTLTFAPGGILTGSAGSFFTADMTAGGLDVQGTLALAQGGSGVTMRLGGLLPTTGTTTLMSWDTLSTGSFKTITYDTGTSLETLTPDLASPALNGGMVSYTAVPDALVFIAVPEPATVSLLAGGAAILGGQAVRRRRRRRVRS